MTAVQCPSCGAALETPLGCGACGALLEVRTDDPFAILGLARSFDVDAGELERRHSRFARLVHPDYYGAAAPGLRELAERNAAALNDAAETLRDPFSRADRIVLDLGGPGEGERREMPKAFLIEVLDWNEALEAAGDAPPGSPQRAALAELEPALRARREGVLGTLRSLLARARGGAELPRKEDLERARAELNALRYLDNMLRQIAASKVEQAASRRA